jgi:hypothetical protein
MCYIIFKSLFFILCLLLLPAYQIYSAVNYKDDIVCSTSLFVDIPIWLVIQGLLSFLLSFLYLSYTCIEGIYYLFLFVYLIWNILGSLIFWKDCYNLTPDNINILMWVSLILGYLFFIDNTCVSMINNKLKKKETLLQNDLFDP